MCTHVPGSMPVKAPGKVLLYPRLQAQLPPCSRCAGTLQNLNLLWQGIHICVEAVCRSCCAHLVADLPMGHATCFPYMVDLERGKVHGPGAFMEWLGEPFLNSLVHPDLKQVSTLRVECRRPANHVVILNCLDYLYGHALLKLLNAELHQAGPGHPDLVVVVPECLAWMAPSWAAEVWTVGGPLKNQRNYIPALSRDLESQLRRFESVELSPAAPHPGAFDISRFTGIASYSESSSGDRVTFIWREDRFWNGVWGRSRALRILRPKTLLLVLQNQAVQRLFEALRRSYPRGQFTVLGLGRSTEFPPWIDDQRVEAFTPAIEKAYCRTYAQSRLVIGVHGSNLLLPSGHAGATLDLMPDERWGNLTEDILYQEQDPRLAAWRYRFVSAALGPLEVARLAVEQMRGLGIHRRLYGERTNAGMSLGSASAALPGND